MPVQAETKRPHQLVLKGFLAGVGAGLAMGMLMVALRLLFGAASLPEVLADGFTGILPPSVFSFLLSTLQTWAKPLMFLGLLLALALAGGGVGAFYALYGRRIPLWRDRPLAQGLTLAPVLLLVTVLFLVASGSVQALPPGGALPFLLSTLAGYLGYALLLVSLVNGTWRSSKAIDGPALPDEGRRRLLKVLGVGVLLLAGGGLTARTLIQKVRSIQPSRVFSTKGRMPPEITPTELFYVVSKNILDPEVDARNWQLQIGGLVQAPYTLTYEELRALPAVEQFTTLICISNEVGGDLISSARWKGVPLRMLLERAGLRDGVRKVAFHGADGLSDSLHLERALSEGVLVAYEMNGEPLPPKHGFPARLLVPGLFGLKSVKWLSRIEAVDFDFQGYWQRRGWTDNATVETMSRIDVPLESALLPKGEGVPVGGLAFAGLRGIRGVEVSTDDGATWRQAVLRRALSPYTWQLWTWMWPNPSEGLVSLTVRATDGQGKVQTAESRPPIPAGATGYHLIFVEIV